MYPAAYIRGATRFMNAEFKVDYRVYIPNKETELLVNFSADFIKSKLRHAKVILDVGTGCGAIAISLARQFPNARVIATDISAEALEVAIANAQFNRVSNIRFLEMNLAGNLAETPSIIICNLPWGREEFMLKSNSAERLSYMPPVSVYPVKGVIGAYLELYQQALKKKWNTIILAEIGRIDRSTVAKELEHVKGWKFIPLRNDYSILLLDPFTGRK